MYVCSCDFVMMSMVLASVCIAAGESLVISSVDRQTIQTRIIYGIATSRPCSEATRTWVHHQQTRNLNSLSYLHTGMLPLCTRVAADCCCFVSIYGNTS